MIKLLIINPNAIARLEFIFINLLISAFLLNSFYAKIEDAATNTGTNYKGDFLMNIGIAWPVKGANKSQILLINAVSAK